jgi:hypothetical protein
MIAKLARLIEGEGPRRQRAGLLSYRLGDRSRDVSHPRATRV